MALLVGRSLKSLCVLAALLVASPAVLCASQQATRDCCLGEQRTPCGVPDPRPHSAPAPTDCCLASPGSPAASAAFVPTRLGRWQLPADNVPPVANITFAPLSAWAGPPKPGKLDDDRGLSRSRELYLLTGRLRL